MKRIVTITLCLMVLATPCLYDLTSREPSPLEAMLPLLGHGAK